MEVNWTIVFILIVILVSADKIITYYNIKAVEKNFPAIDKLQIEKNPLAKKIFQKYGLEWGSVIYWFISILTFFIALALIEWCLSLFKIPNSFSIALWIMVIIYCAVIGSNLFFLLKYSKVIP